ncbi:MAG: hypothetical protein KGR17_10965 [Acidobacteria bacterium]|nr:hypothetical protein [Acidobacteriota bacterium]
MKSLVIVGAGGFGRETLDVLRAMDPDESEFAFAGFVAQDEPAAGVLARIDASWLGSDEDFLTAPSASHYVIAIADPACASGSPGASTRPDSFPRRSSIRQPSVGETLSSDRAR